MTSEDYQRVMWHLLHHVGKMEVMWTVTQPMGDARWNDLFAGSRCGAPLHQGKPVRGRELRSVGDGLTVTPLNRTVSFGLTLV